MSRDGGEEGKGMAVAFGWRGRPWPRERGAHGIAGVGELALGNGREIVGGIAPEGRTDPDPFGWRQPQPRTAPPPRFLSEGVDFKDNVVGKDIKAVI